MKGPRHWGATWTDWRQRISREWNGSLATMEEAALEALAWLLIWVRPLLPGGQRTRPWPLSLRVGPKSVVFLNNSYYHFLFLARELRSRGWDAWAVDNDRRQTNQDMNSFLYHGEDIPLYSENRFLWRLQAKRCFHEIKRRYSLLQFYGMGRLHIDPYARSHLQGPDGVLTELFMMGLPAREMEALRRAGVVIGYSVAGCTDGIESAEWNAWTGGMCDHCRLRREDVYCSQRRNAAWGRQMLGLCNVICAELMPRIGALRSAKVVTLPTSYGVDPDLWRPNMPIPDRLRLPPRSSGEIIAIHAVANLAYRTEGNADPKGTSAIAAAVESLRAEGVPIRLELVHGVAGIDMRFILAQADIVIDQLRFGRYGALGRESLMLGKPVVGFLQWRDEDEDPETRECLRECPIVNATPETIGDVLRELVLDSGRRRVLGERSREYALKWHSVKASADRFEALYRDLLGKNQASQKKLASRRRLDKGADGMRSISHINDIPKGAPLYLYGAGGAGVLILKKLLRVRDINVKGFIDTYKKGTEILGFPVYDLDDFLNMKSDDALVLITSTYFEEISKRLKERKFIKFANAYPIYIDIMDRRLLMKGYILWALLFSAIGAAVWAVFF